MNFKKIELFGFKSFADKLNIQFEPGITAIVGPNGCGKSNVADSIRWVLGEQSAKTLRGSNMQDVIFAGTQNRKSLSYCEVSLFFDNTNKMFDIEYNEVSITRKLYRSGESEYLMNKKPCRLKDIIDLLRQAGMGKGGYSIIGQGKIDEILSSKPGDRRGIFEEATGIAKFKSKKQETERKLDRTRENLTRINDILGELERQIGPLKKQSEDARKYLDLYEDQKYHEINNYIYQYESASETKADISSRLAAVTEENEQKSRELEECTLKYNECLENMSNADRDVETLRDSQLDLTIKLEKQTGEVNINRERIKYMGEQNSRLEREVHDASERYVAVSNDVTEKIKVRDNARLRLDSLSGEYKEKQEQLLAIVSEISVYEDKNQSSQAEVIDSINKMAELKANLSGLGAEKSTLEKRVVVVSQKMDEIEKQLKGSESTIACQQTAIDELEEIQVKKEERKSELRDNLFKLETELKSAQREIVEFKNQYSSAETKQKLLKSMRDNMDGYQYSVKKLLQSAQTDSNLKGKIEGLVSRLMTTDQEFEVAIETALGGAMQNIVTNTREDAKYLINYLKYGKLGRATFLPIDGVTPRFLDGGEKRMLNVKGCYGVACDLIKYDKKYESIYRSLLGKTLIVDTIDTAVQLSKMQAVTCKIVSLDGDVISPGGAMSGGSRKSEASSTLGYDREIKETGELLEQLAKSLNETRDKRNALETKRQDCLDILDEVEEDIHARDIQINTQMERLDKLKNRMDEYAAEFSEFTSEHENISSRLDYIVSAQAEIDKLEAFLKDKNVTVNQETQKLHEEFTKLKSERDDISENITAIKVEIAQKTEFISSINEEIKRLNDAIISANEQMRNAQDSIKTNNEIIGECQKLIDLAIMRVEDDDEIRDIKNKLSNLDGFRAELKENLSKYDRLKSELTQDIQRISDSKLKIEFALEKVDTDIAAMQERIAEEYGLSYESALPFKDDDYACEDSNKEIAKLKRQIANLGYVNVSAIEQYKEVGTRYEDMNTQRNDLVSAEGDLVKIIGELTEEMLTRFNSGFKQINENFIVIFKELFGGGNANLILEPSESGDALEDGIEIVAEPPGKKLQSISLLSGGERALTAIAILFAILRLRPMPFCVLDEIEAALDDANADRFARYLHKFSRQTQFIVITHRKPTMELADALYGVTMEEKGVSKMVSVKLAEVIDKLDNVS